mgnify:CR=1 FL=1
MIPIPSASLPKGGPNGAPVTSALNLTLAAVAGKERQNVERLNTPSFSEIKSKDKESSGQIPNQEQGKQFENQSYLISYPKNQYCHLAKLQYHLDLSKLSDLDCYRSLELFY